MRRVRTPELSTRRCGVVPICIMLYLQLKLGLLSVERETLHMLLVSNRLICKQTHCVLDFEKYWHYFY